ncbi:MULTISPECIES: methyl-accepting chemotaxis protein [unclassified Yoonia]|uniref:methyl-accepting chemotaxis protein n=1 Tax=unclassified Yoonia TaxID=2629118 RepID=UPI002AFE893C|nr:MULTISPECIES: methyl-accepting chemotaxis protein [unclassified Yoonia]
MLSFLKKVPPPPDPLLTLIDQTQAVIRFTVDGTIVTANDNFLKAVEYDLSEIVGRHHRMFVEPRYAESPEYGDFWKRLGQGQPFTDCFPRLTKSGRTIWIQATYGGVRDLDGRIGSVIKIATDVTPRTNAFIMIGKGLQALSNGDFSGRLPMFGLSDVDPIGTAFNRAASDLSDMMQSVSRIAGQVRAVSGDLEGASAQLSARTTAQAATLEQTAASLEELTTTVRLSTDSLRDAENLASETVSGARKSDEVVKRAIDAMAEIETSSGEISKIIAVINDIAFQTNLLALNAGVEAARAGDAGRGFAVVASEVRGLAHRAQSAAGDIKTLISRSAGHVSTGVGLVNDTGRELRTIVESIGKISDAMRTIAESARQQSIALDELNSGVGHLDIVTQQNAGMVDQMAQVNATLTTNVAALIDQMARFDASDRQPLLLRRAS